MVNDELVENNTAKKPKIMPNTANARDKNERETLISAISELYLLQHTPKQGVWTTVMIERGA